MAEKCFCGKLERNFCKILTIPASQGQKGGYQKNGFWVSPDPSITSNILFGAKYFEPHRKYHVPRTFKITLLSNSLYRVIALSAVHYGQSGIHQCTMGNQVYTSALWVIRCTPVHYGKSSVHQCTMQYFGVHQCTMGKQVYTSAP